MPACIALVLCFLLSGGGHGGSSRGVRGELRARGPWGLWGLWGLWRRAYMAPGILLIDATPLLEVVARGVVVLFAGGCTVLGRLAMQSGWTRIGEAWNLSACIRACGRPVERTRGSGECLCSSRHEVDSVL